MRTTRYNTMSTPTSTSSSRKRKAGVDDELVSGRKLKIAKPSPSSSPAAHLPASCLAAILNFMEYSEVRRCLLAGKIMAVDSARHVETLNIMNASELVPSAARRFANVTNVYILSLVTTDEGGDEDILSADTATRSVPFLISFPKLQRAFLGGLWWDPDDLKWSKIAYGEPICDEPKDHLAIFRGLVDHLCGAFRSRSLSPSLHLKGVFERDQLECHKDEKGDGHRCRRCWNIATSFPPVLVLEKIPLHDACGLCLSYSEHIEALASRNDNPLRFHPQAAIKSFLDMTGTMFESAYIYSYTDVKKSFVEMMKSRGAKTGKMNSAAQVYYCQFFYMAVEDIEALRKFSTAIGPSTAYSIPKRELLSAVPQCGAADDGKKRVLVRQTFESLVQLGFDLASKDFVLIDPLKEAALEKMHSLFRSEEEAS